MGEPPSSNLDEAASAGLWSTADLLLRQGTQFGVSIVLARLLSPSDFGLIALAGFFLTLALVLVQGGLSTALVQRLSTTQEDESAVFWLKLGSSVLLAAGALMVAHPLAGFYAQPLLAPLMSVVAGQIVLSSLGSVQNALLSRALAFATLTKIGVTASLLSGGIGVVMAFAGYGVWALAMMMLSSTAFNTVGVWLFSNWRPTAHFHTPALKEMMRFGGWISISSTLEVIYTQGFALLLGRFYGIRELGLYNRGASTQLLPSSLLSNLIARIALPIFSRRSQDDEAIRRGAKLAIGLAMLVNVPAMVGLAILSPLVISVLYGSRWLGAAPILSILSIGGILFPLHVINLNIVLAMGRSDIYLRLEVAKKLFGIGCIVVGSFFGVRGLAWGQVIASIVALGINTAPVGRMIGYPCIRQLSDLRGLLLPVLAMTMVTAALYSVLPLPDYLMLPVLVITGGVIYVGTGLAINSEPFVRAMELASRLIRARGGKVTLDPPY